MRPICFRELHSLHSESPARLLYAAVFRLVVQTHVRAHTRPFQCPIPECRRRFGWSVDMKRHIEKIHGRHFSEFPGCLNVPPPSEIEFPGPPGSRLTLADALSQGGMDVHHAHSAATGKSEGSGAWQRHGEIGTEIGKDRRRDRHRDVAQG